MKNKELIKHLDRWQKELQEHLKDFAPGERVEAVLVLSEMIEKIEELKK